MSGGGELHGGAVGDPEQRDRGRRVPLLVRLGLGGGQPGHARRGVAHGGPDLDGAVRPERDELRLLRRVRGRDGVRPGQPEQELHVRRTDGGHGEPVLLAAGGAGGLGVDRDLRGLVGVGQDAGPVRRVRPDAQRLELVRPVGDLRLAAAGGEDALPGLGGRRDAERGDGEPGVQRDQPLGCSEPGEQRLQLDDQHAGVEHELRGGPGQLRRVEPDRGAGHAGHHDGEHGPRPGDPERGAVAGEVEHHRGDGVRGRELRRRGGEEPGDRGGGGAGVHGAAAGGDGGAVRRRGSADPQHDDGCGRGVRVRGADRRGLHGAGGERQRDVVAAGRGGDAAGGADVPDGCEHRYRGGRDERGRRVEPEGPGRSGERGATRTSGASSPSRRRPRRSSRGSR